MIHDVCVCVPKSIGGGGGLCSVQLKHWTCITLCQGNQHRTQLNTELTAGYEQQEESRNEQATQSGQRKDRGTAQDPYWLFFFRHAVWLNPRINQTPFTKIHRLKFEGYWKLYPQKWFTFGFTTWSALKRGVVAHHGNLYWPARKGWAAHQADAKRKAKDLSRGHRLTVKWNQKASHSRTRAASGCNTFGKGENAMKTLCTYEKEKLEKMKRWKSPA
jgi:hypothetical protein